MRGKTFHGRKGAISNAFSYGVDYVLIDPTSPLGPRLFSRGSRNVTAVHDSDHGGPPRAGAGLAWVRDVLDQHEVGFGGQILLLTQPRVLGHVFNPVSFWLCHDRDSALRVVIAEVSNTFGDRHSYLCHRDDRAPITRDDTLSAQKIFHVSPFQPIAGGYQFRFDIAQGRIGIWIDFDASAEYGLLATLTGRLAPLTNAGILAMMLRRPFGSRRVLALIHWQALKLFFKGARYHPHTPPPAQDVSK
ncbi:MAG: DUF1365 domain-containing protein [Cypionkella sp.]|nr:DUF1365 domain-containing protein [Cypionkella sp.]